MELLCILDCGFSLQLDHIGKVVSGPTWSLAGRDWIWQLGLCPSLSLSFRKPFEKSISCQFLSVLIVMVNLLNSSPLLIISQLECNSCLVLMKCVFHELPCWLRKLQLFFLSKQIHTLTFPAGQSQWWIITYHLSEISKLSPLMTENTKPSNEKAGRVNSLAEFLIVCSGSSQWCSWLSLESYACCFGFEHHVSLIFSTSHRDKYHKYLLEGLLPLGTQYILLGSLSDSGTEGRIKVDSLPSIPSGRRKNKKGNCCFLQLPEASLSCFVENKPMAFSKTICPLYEQNIPSSIVQLILGLDFFASQCGPGWSSEIHNPTHHQKWTFTSSVQQSSLTESTVLFFSLMHSKLTKMNL